MWGRTGILVQCNILIRLPGRRTFVVEGTWGEQSMTLLMTVCHMTDSELVMVVAVATASKAEAPAGLEGRSYHKAVFGPGRDEHELRVGCGILGC